MFYKLLQRWLFKCDPEWSHDFSLRQLRRFAQTPIALLWKQRIVNKPTRVMGIDFPNPVGLAAGLDKNGECIAAFAQMGFGFIEIGTVTPRAQAGNPAPRMFRIPEREALINRMGFNNKGVEHLVKQVRASNFKGVLGINIGKNKDTDEANAVADYTFCMERVYPLASYITVNISSPNTPGLRAFQHGQALDELLAALKQKQHELAKTHNRYVPLAVKIAPDLSEDEIAAMARAFQRHQIDAVIATNTTLERDSVQGLEHADEAGGLSGAILAERSTEVVKQFYSILGEDIPIIAVGGVHSPETAQQKFAAGAKLVQIYTGFIYSGPSLIKQIVTRL